MKQYYPTFCELPKTGDIVELINKDKQLVALGKIESVDKDERIAEIEILIMEDIDVIR
jgi:hypothetical protein